MISERDTFSTYNPLINFIFFIGAIVQGMFFIHPGFLACALVMSAAYYFTIKGTGAVKLLMIMLPIFALLTVINPIFNRYGQTVLFTYFGGRPYTLEALYYGIAMGVMFVVIVIWFACYSAVMTSDKFMYIFGRFIPSVSMILTMVLRLIPDYQKKLVQIGTARKCIGKGTNEGTKKEKIHNGMTVLSTLTTWAFEGGISTADSMRSRGYGSGGRTAFSIYRFDGRDKTLTVIMALLIVITCVCGFAGGAAAEYTPRLIISGSDDPFTTTGIIAYGLFLIIPTALNIKEAITWHVFRSRI